MSEVRHNPSERRFEIGTGESIAILEYLERPGAVVFTHTYVPPELRGGGIAHQLVAAGVTYARAQGKSIVPACSYVARWLEREGS